MKSLPILIIQDLILLSINSIFYGNKYKSLKIY